MSLQHVVSPDFSSLHAVVTWPIKVIMKFTPLNVC